MLEMVGSTTLRVEVIPSRRLEISIFRENQNTGIVYFLRNGRTKLKLLFFFYKGFLILFTIFSEQKPGKVMLKFGVTKTYFHTHPL